MNEKHSKRLLIVLYYYRPYTSGVSVYAQRLAEGLVRKGYQVTVLASHHDKQLPKSEIMNGVKVLRVPVLFNIGKGPIMPTFLIEIIRQSLKHDIINFQLPMAEAGLITMFTPKNKNTIYYHCDIYLGDGILSRLITTMSFLSMRIAIKRSSRVIASTKDYIEHSRMRAFAPRVTSAYPIINPGSFKPTNSDDLFAERLHINQKTKRIGFVGRIVYEKGIDYLLDSVRYLENSIDNFKIIIAGDYEKIAGGSTKDKLDKFIDKYKDRIILTGYLTDEDLVKFYSGLDVLVLPSIDPLEAFGMVQVEAMLCGTPVVSSDLPGVREIVNKTGFGRISKVRDSKDIAKQILEVVNNRDKYKPKRDVVVGTFNPSLTYRVYQDIMDK